MEARLAREIPIPHPGVILKEEFLDPMGISVYALANAIGVSRGQLNDVCHGRHRITAPLALKLGRYLGVDAGWFMNMQSKYDLEVSREEMSDVLAAIEPRSAA